MKRKIVCLLLAVIMIFGACAVLTSCGGKECSHSDRDKDGICDKCSENMPNAKCEHDDANGDGKCDKCEKPMGNDVIEYPWADEDPVELIFQMSHNSNGSLPSRCARYLAGEFEKDPDYKAGQQRDTIDTMVSDRNDEAYGEVNVFVTYNYYPDLNSDYSWGETILDMDQDIRSKSPKKADMFCNFQYDMIGVYLKGSFANLKSIKYTGENYFEFTHEDYNELVDNRGYMYDYMESTTLNKDKMYILASDYFTDLIRAFFVVPVNVKLLTQVGPEITGERDGKAGFTIDDFYAQVMAKEWTYELAAQYSEKVYKKGDANTSSGESLHDTLGFAIHTSGLPATAVVYTTKIDIIEEGRDPVTGKKTFKYPDDCQDLYDLAAALNNFMDATGVLCIKKDACASTTTVYGTGADAIRTRFCTDNILFGGTVCIGALEMADYQRLKNSPGSGFGVVPVPLYHSVDADSDETYMTTIHNLGRPGGIAYNTTKFSECSAFLNYQSTHSTDILNYYYDYQLQYNVADGSTGTIEMLQYIRLNVRSAFDKTFEDAVGIYGSKKEDRWHDILAAACYEEENMRQKYQDKINDKKQRLKQLYEEFGGLPG